jgi:hypothetical protein
VGRHGRRARQVNTAVKPGRHGSVAERCTEKNSTTIQVKQKLSLAGFQLAISALDVEYCTSLCHFNPNHNDLAKKFQNISNLFPIVRPANGSLTSVRLLTRKVIRMQTEVTEQMEVMELTGVMELMEMPIYWSFVRFF